MNSWTCSSIHEAKGYHVCVPRTREDRMCHLLLMYTLDTLTHKALKNGQVSVFSVGVAYLCEPAHVYVSVSVIVCIFVHVCVCEQLLISLLP